MLELTSNTLIENGIDVGIKMIGVEKESGSEKVAGDYIEVHAQGNWLINSGASNHYTSNKNILSEFVTCNDIQVMTGGGLVQAKGKGNVTLHTSEGIQKVFDVLWIPDLAGANNLLSMPQLV